MEALALTSGLTEMLESSGVSSSWIPYVELSILLTITIIICGIVDWVAKKILLQVIGQVVKRTKTTWDDALLENKVFKNLAHLVPAVVFELLSPQIFHRFPNVLPFVEHLVSAYMILVTLIAIGAFLNSLRVIFQNSTLFKDKPVDSYFQLSKIVIYLFGGVLIISTLLEKSPVYFFSAFGAMTAVVLLVFRDTILGFVASIQLGANDMVRLGDWVEMPKYGADGDIIEINLTTIKVRNWDKTITTIPTYAFISDSFKNWRGMSESGGRRIKRSIHINMNTVRFCNQEMLDRFRKVQILSKHVEDKLIEIEKHNRTKGIDPEVEINGRRLTNLGVFRAYIYMYLENHPWVNKEMTLLVRQLSPDQFGIPIEIYCFSSDKVWANYERIQSDIFDHILAAIPLFELSVFQSPSGKDIEKLSTHFSQGA